MNIALAAIGACALIGCTDTPHVSGRVCVVLDLRYPRECPGHQLVGGLDVVELGTGLTGVTDDDGSFRIDTPKELTTATIRVGPGETLRSTNLVKVGADALHDVIVPQIATPVWMSYLGQFGGTDDPTLGSIHASYEPPGSFVAQASASGAGQVFYNQGNAFDWKLTPPGDQVVAVLALGVPPGTSSLSLTLQDDTMTQFDDEPIEAGTITWVNLAK